MPLPAGFFALLAAILGSYLTCVELAKRRVLRRYATLPARFAPSQFDAIESRHSSRDIQD